MSSRELTASVTGRTAVVLLFVLLMLLFIIVVDRVGIEPTTNCLRGSCSTTELPVHNWELIAKLPELTYLRRVSMSLIPVITVSMDFLLLRPTRTPPTKPAAPARTMQISVNIDFPTVVDVDGGNPGDRTRHNWLMKPASVPYCTTAYRFLEPAMGVEPMASSLPRMRSTS